MAAFERIRSGISGLDKALDGIRLGDNVVWQVSRIEDYARLVQPYVAQTLSEGRKTIYIRFAHHAPLLLPTPGLVIHTLDASEGFEPFTGRVHEIITQGGLEAFYVFDSLSELQVAWSADLMMGNFFMVTCPFLFELDTVAWFAVLRHRHSYDTVARIRETTQLLVELYSDESALYIHPLKVWRRYSPTMFFPHRLDPLHLDSLEPLTDGVAVSKFYALVGLPSSDTSVGHQNLDSWDRFFLRTRRESVLPGADLNLMAHQLAERLMGSESRLKNLVCKHFSVSDLLDLRERLIGSGKIGGKASGMLLSRKIVIQGLPTIALSIEPHDSYYIGSDVFYTFLVHNNLWKLRIQQRTPEYYLSKAEELKAGILAGKFPDAIRQQFLRMLEYYGQSPIIARSSSLLEDSFGHAFAGKYESIFCTNAGSPEDRMLAFEDAVRRVYASTMDESALEYRLNRGLQGQDEQMAILVQRVSGSLYQDFFMPSAAGVGYSYNSYRWNQNIDPKAGMLRLVMGLGTRAVDRTGGDYPRLVSLDQPSLLPTGTEDVGKYCQRTVDGLDLNLRTLASRSIDELVPQLPEWYKNMVVQHDTVGEEKMREMGKEREVYLSTCQGLVNNFDFLRSLKLIMQQVQKEYQCPVDMEFTVNVAPNGTFVLNLLQCHPLHVTGAGPKIHFPSLEPVDIFLELCGGTMGPSLDTEVDVLVIVNPRAYYEMPFKEKSGIARAIGHISRFFKDQGKTLMLMSPGRIGTTSPELGVPVSFAEIAGIKILCEVSYKDAGYSPELSFGSHFFQDLVEAEIYYAAVHEGEMTRFHNTSWFQDTPNDLEKILPEQKHLASILQVYQEPHLRFLSDLVSGRCLCSRFKG